ncbi:hypothetical protein Dimus_026817, partial [Dionaea muscipula]
MDNQKGIKGTWSDSSSNEADLRWQGEILFVLFTRVYPIKCKATTLTVCVCLPCDVDDGGQPET